MTDPERLLKDPPSPLARLLLRASAEEKPSASALRRAAKAAMAAAAAGARVERALEILGPDAPQHLTMAGKLRMAHRQASLEELGQLADPRRGQRDIATANEGVP